MRGEWRTEKRNYSHQRWRGHTLSTATSFHPELFFCSPVHSHWLEAVVSDLSSPPPFRYRLLSAGCLSLSPWLHIVCGEQDVVGPRCPVLCSQTHWPSGCLWRGLHKASGGVSYTVLLYQVKIIELTCDVSPLQERSLLDSAFSLQRWQQAGLWEDPCLRIGWIHGLKNLMQHHKALEFFVKSGD